MKTTKFALSALTAAGFALFSLSVQADPVVTGSALPGRVTQLPGSPADYFFFPNASSTDVNNPTSVLTDFTVASNGDTFGGTSLETPLGGTITTGATYDFGPLNGHPSTETIAQFTLGNSTSFDYSNFDVYLLYGNSQPTSTFDTSAYTLTPTAFTINGTAPTAPFGGATVDTTEVFDSGSGQIVEFNVQDATPGETFSILATTQGSFADLDAISFAQDTTAAPEPSTWALLLGGMGFLGWLKHARQIKA